MNFLDQSDEIKPEEKRQMGRLSEKTGHFTMTIPLRNRTNPITIPVQIQLFESLQFPDGAFIVISSRQHHISVPAKSHCAISLRHARLDCLPDGKSIRIFGKSGEGQSARISAETTEQATEWFPLLKKYTNQSSEVKGELRTSSAKFSPIKQRHMAGTSSLQRHHSMDTVIESLEDDL